MTDTGVQRANDRLLDLLAEMRPDWPDLDIRGVIVGAEQAGITWESAAWQLVRFAGDPDARPRDLLPVHRDQTRRNDPDAYSRGAALARSAITRTEDQ